VSFSIHCEERNILAKKRSRNS